MPLIICVVLLAYLGGYLGARSANSVTGLYPRGSSVRTNIWTCIQVHSGDSGISRAARYSLFYLYYPMGQLDKLANSRDYQLLDRSFPAFQATICRSKLRVLQNAKALWSQEQHKTTNDTPTWPDLIGTNGYLEAQLFCPDGGVVTIGRVGESPKCSVPGHSK